MIHVTDWLPTFLSMAGAKTSSILSNIDGIDQWKSLKQNVSSARTEMLYNIDPKPDSSVKVEEVSKSTLRLPSTGLTNVWA